MQKIYILLFVSIFFSACTKSKEGQLFELVENSGIQFTNTVTDEKDNNIFKYRNFYNGGGSKLKSTATEYVKMNEYWNAQGIEFIWITDGAGWFTTLRPLREYFDKAEYLLNLEMLKDRILPKVLK